MKTFISISFLFIICTISAQNLLPIDTILFSNDGNSCIVTNFESATINDKYYPIFEIYDNLNPNNDFHFAIIKDSVR